MCIRDRSGELSRLHGRAGGHQPQADRHFCAAVPARDVAAGLSPEKGILEGCALNRKWAMRGGLWVSRGLGASDPFPVTRPRFLSLITWIKTYHDEPLFRHYLSLFPALPHRALREGHGL